jgi:hypothetical protein
MTRQRVLAGILSLVLFGLLFWSVLAGGGDIRTWILLAVGGLLGSVYAAFGSLPEWIVDYTGDCITDEDDAANISMRIYLPILIGVILVAMVTFGLFVFVL